VAGGVRRKRLVSIKSKILVHEFTESTGALDVLVEEFIKPTFIKLSSIVREIVGDKYPNKKEELCAMSILGLYLYFRNARPIVFRLRHKEGYTNEDIREIAEHIINFSLVSCQRYSVISKESSRLRNLRFLPAVEMTFLD
jgi:hypothetical protein